MQACIRGEEGDDHLDQLLLRLGEAGPGRLALRILPVRLRPAHPVDEQWLGQRVDQA